MDFSMIVDFVTQQGIWCALFVWLFYTSRKESLDRENKLTTIIEQHGEQLKQITDTLQSINNKIDTVEAGLHELEDTQ